MCRSDKSENREASVWPCVLYSKRYAFHRLFGISLNTAVLA